MTDSDLQRDSHPTMLRALSEHQQVRLTEILDEYLRQLENNEAPSRKELIENFPELGDALGLYLDKLEDLHAMAGGGGNSIGSDLTGRILGDYRLDSEIGRGGMGIVYGAQQLSLDRKVAVKLLPMVAMLEPRFVERFRNEARAAGQLEHPNIVPVLTVGEDSGIHYYAMRLIEGQSLDRRIDNHRQQATHPPTNSALMQFANVADALHTAHQYGIVHRDIKPSNLLLDNDGKLWVTDFGLARIHSDKALTATGEMVGTMRYMSPEQATASQEFVDHRSDIYSLAVTLYELLTGQSAVQGEEGPGLLNAIAHQTPVRIRKLRPELPRDLQVVLEKAMARHRDDRYATAEELADDLRRIARNEPIQAKRIPAIVTMTRWMADHPESVSFSLAAVLALGLIVSTATYMVNKMIASERDLALNNLGKALAMERQLSDTIDQLAMIPGGEGVRRRAIPISLDYYIEFVDQFKDDPNLQDELGNAYTRMGMLKKELGEPLEAAQNFEAAEAVYARMEAADEMSVEAQVNRLENLNHLAMALSGTGMAQAAAEILAEPVQRYRLLASEIQDNRGLALEYGLSENNLGLLMRKQGRLNEAKTAFGNSVRLLRAIKQEEIDQEVSRGLGAALHNLGSLLAADGSPETRVEANQHLQEALSIQQNLAQTAENGLRASIDLVATYLTVGGLELESDNLSGAVDAFDHAVAISRRLVHISPQVDSYRRDLAVGLSNLGMAHYQSGDYENARSQLQDSVHQYRLLLANYPEHTGLQSSLGIALNNQGIVLQHLREYHAADEAYDRAAKLLEAANPTPYEALQKVYVNHVRMLRDAGRENEADELLKRQTALAARHDAELLKREKL